jgi:hypothetical protein
MATLSKNPARTDPGTVTPIIGGSVEVNTTGYPTPPSPNPSHAVVKTESAVALKDIRKPADDYPLFPSHPAISFSIGDLQHIGKVDDLDRFAFVFRFVEPAQGQLRQFAVQITSPDGKVLHQVRLEDGGLNRPQSEFVFTIDEAESERAEKCFVLGNRITIVAEATTEVTRGVVQVGLRSGL